MWDLGICLKFGENPGPGLPDKKRWFCSWQAVQNFQRISTERLIQAFWKYSIFVYNFQALYNWRIFRACVYCKVAMLTTLDNIAGLARQWEQRHFWLAFHFYTKIWGLVLALTLSRVGIIVWNQHAGHLAYIRTSDYMPDSRAGGPQFWQHRDFYDRFIVINEIFISVIPEMTVKSLRKWFLYILKARHEDNILGIIS